jgi:sulfate adenylyltransferase
VVGMTKPGDFDHYTRVRCYKAVTGQYPPDAFLLNLLPFAMRMAGPKEALLHAIVSKNYGCSHFIVGRDHAGPGRTATMAPFYAPNAATDLAKAHSQELEIDIVPFEELVYLPFEDEYQTKDKVPEGVQTISLVRLGHPAAHPVRQAHSRLGHLPQWSCRCCRRPIRRRRNRASPCS